MLSCAKEYSLICSSFNALETTTLDVKRSNESINHSVLKEILFLW